MKKFLSDLVAKVTAKLAAEPAVVAGVLAGAVVLLAGHFHVVLDKPTVTSVLTPVVVGVLTRFHVTPKSKKA